MFTMEIEINCMVPFPGTQLFNRSSHEETKVYVKLTNTGLLLHYKSHVDVRYKRALLRPMLDRAFRLSFDWSYFCEECDRLKLLFSRLKYPGKLINSTISRHNCHKSFWAACFIASGCFWFIWLCSCYFTISRPVLSWHCSTSTSGFESQNSHDRVSSICQPKYWLRS